MQVELSGICGTRSCSGSVLPELLLELTMINGAAMPSAVEQVIYSMEAKCEQDNLIGRAPSGHEEMPRREGGGEGEFGQKASDLGAAGEVGERIFALPA